MHQQDLYYNLITTSDIKHLRIINIVIGHNTRLIKVSIGDDGEFTKHNYNSPKIGEVAIYWFPNHISTNPAFNISFNIKIDVKQPYMFAADAELRTKLMVENMVSSVIRRLALK
jgi:hypothetical protein